MDIKHCGASCITGVERQKKNAHRYNIFINEEYAFSVHEDILVKHRRLRKGETIQKEDIESILSEDEEQKAFHEALKYVGRKPRSTKEVEQMLKEKGYETNINQRIIEKLKDQKYLNDGQFAAAWTEHRIYSHKKGRKWVQQELLQKGVSKEEIIHAMGQINEEEEYACALDLAKKKWKVTTAGGIRERKQKVGLYLLRRGYSNSLVNRVLNDLQSVNNEDIIDN